MINLSTYCNVLVCILLVQTIAFADTNEFINCNTHFKSGDITWQQANGFDSSFISSADINNDGILDLIIQSLITGETLAYENSINGFTINSTFGKNQHIAIAWSTYKDGDGDNIADKISYNFENQLSFQKGYFDNNLLKFNTASNANFLAESTVFDPLDQPIFLDEDQDGDIDILTVPLSSEYLHLYQNQSIELTGQANFGPFNLVNSCWADMKFAFNSDSIFFNEACTEFVTEPLVNKRSQHLIPSLTAIDFDDDYDLDLVAGNALGPNLNCIFNEGGYTFNGTADFSTMLNQEVSINGKPLAISYDVNLDGQDDLLVIKSFFNEEEKDFFWHYEATSNGSYTLQTKNFLQESFIDLGSNTFPIWKDVNEDGLQDILIATKGAGLNSGASKIIYFQNIGTAISPSFNLVNEDWLNLKQHNLQSIKFCFGDINNDGNEDIILGNSSNNIYYMLAWANTNQVLNQLEKDFFVSNASPLFFDVNQDGFEDLLIGEHAGSINYLINNGFSNEVSFQLESEFFAEISTSLYGLPYGQNYLSKFQNENGSESLFVANSESLITEYDVSNYNSEQTIVQINQFDLSGWTSSFSGFSLANINNSSQPELLIGHKEGGIHILQNASQLTEIESDVYSNQNINIYPNPVQSMLHFSTVEFDEFSLINFNGSEIISGKINNRNNVLDISQQIAGIYYLILKNNKRHIINKIIKY